MNSALTFSLGLLLIALFAWYFLTSRARTKRNLATALTVFTVGLSFLAIHPPAETVRLGLDLQGGTSFLIRLLPDEGREITSHSLEQAVEVIRKRVDMFGVSEPVIVPQGSNRILVQIPGLGPEQIAAARQQLAQVAKLEFRLVHPESDRLIPLIGAGSQIIPPGYRIESETQIRRGEVLEGKLLVRQRADLLGTHVKKAVPMFEDRGWGISLEFDSEGAEEFGRLTAAHVHERFAIVLDGKIQSAPVIQDAIYGGRASITGNFSETEARNLASVLENPLQNQVRIEEERSVSATLGSDSIKSGIYSGLLGLVLTFLLVLAYYRFAGAVAIVALLVNLLLLFGAMTIFGFVLTLPGIAGIILTIGMAVDANVLIYERLREELAAGESLRVAVGASYDKAFSAIFDSNLTTLITAVILFWQATGPGLLRIVRNSFCADLSV